MIIVSTEFMIIIFINYTIKATLYSIKVNHTGLHLIYLDFIICDGKIKKTYQTYTEQHYHIKKIKLLIAIICMVLHVNTNLIYLSYLDNFNKLNIYLIRKLNLCQFSKIPCSFPSLLLQIFR